MKREAVWKRIHRILSEADGWASLEGATDEKALREKWKKRAEELAKPAQAAEDGLHKEKILILEAGKERYAFRVDDVEEVMRLPAVTPVPCVPAHFAGVINRRGSILPLVDLKVFFGEKSSPDSRESRVVVLSRNRMSLGLLVEAADEIVALSPASIRPPLKRGEGIREEFCSGMITMGKKLVALIDTSRLLTDDRLKVDRAV